AEGPFCTDIDGNILMDFTSHVAAAPLGYNNPKIIDKFREFDLVDPLKIAGQDFYVSGSGPTESPDFPGPPQLMDRLIDITSHYNLNTVFLSNSGAESVENALKICYDNRPSAKYGITFTGAFHGRTIGTLSLNRSKSEHRSFYPEISAIHDVPFCENSACDRESCECGFFPSSGKSLLRQKLEQPSGHIDPDEVAYLIIEPIQGEGGYRFPSDTFMEEIGDICDTYNIPIIVDEIQAGLGRTGRMWGCDHYSIDPDVITAAKGLRVGATISTQDIFPDTKGRISSTWGGGDIISSFLGVLTLDAIEEYNLMQNAINQGNSFTERLLDRDLPEFV
ncbi:MAG: aminotransferase class III-fold pyridoxal phosphate-dependent enzyme, partial [Halobacteriaceae archaeon]